MHLVGFTIGRYPDFSQPVTVSCGELGD